ncbi:MAG TPA: SCO family protein, partial [Methylomirabilota bacterium]|nr:SCO family protein [Methylomirabilota bacterium]
AGQALLAALAMLIVVEGGWVAVKVRTARQLDAANASPASLPAALPADYPRQQGPAPDFALVNQDGSTIALSRFRGRPVVVTFVFAHCQALCPLIVQSLEDGAAGADVLLVTLDPWRDTPSSLPAIARQWKTPPGFHVLSARRPADVVRVIEAWGVPTERDDKTGDISHPGVVFLVDADGRLAYTFNNPSAAWVREALHRLRKSDRTLG